MQHRGNAGARFAMLGILASLALAGCRQPESAPSLQRDGLIQLAFKGCQPTDKGREVPMPVSDDAGTNSDKMGVTPLEVVRLSDERAVMLTKGQPLLAGHGTRAVLGAYWYKRQGERWRLDQRQDQVARLGIFGDFDATQIVELNKGAYGLAVEQHQAGMGVYGVWVELFKLGSDKVAPLLGDDLQTVGNNQGTMQCEDFLKQAPGKPIRHHIEGDDSAPPDCFDVVGKWQIAPGKDQPGDINAKFVSKFSSHKIRHHTEDKYGYVTLDYDVLLREVRSQQLFRYQRDTGMYKLISGSNLVPPGHY